MRCTERCAECPSRDTVLGSKPVISGDYSPSSEILFVAEAPGREENNRHRIFVGKAGAELNDTYLPLAGMSRPEVSLTNSVKCHWADSSDPPPASLVRSCTEFHLRRELAYHKPRVVILMGGVANSLMKYDIELEHGIMHKGTLLGWTGWIYSTYHPALGLHMPSAMLQLVDDFRRLRGYLNGSITILKDNCPNPIFMKLTEPSQVAEIMNGHDHAWEPIAVDTESKKRWRGYPSTAKYIPWCISFCLQLGEAFVIRVEDELAMAEFLRQLHGFNEVVFHNSAYDYEIISRIHAGLAAKDLAMIPWSRVQDTMAMAYHDGRMPKKLKVIGYRILAKYMESFDEVVIPHSREAALEYIEHAMSMDWPKPVQEPTGLTVVKKCPDCKGTGMMRLGTGKFKRLYKCDCDGGTVTVPKMTRKQGMNDKLYRLVTDLKKNPDIDLWERWEGWGTQIDPLIAKIGPIPLPSIEYVPEDKAIQYAAGDAHETLRIYPILRKRLADLRRSVRGC